MRDCCNNISSLLLPEKTVYKEVVIIGNGPSGISLSCLLSGHWPYYNGKPHADEMLTMRLRSLDNDHSIIEQDLRFLSESLEGRSHNPVSVLMDCLSHPNDDQNMERSSDCLLTWKYHPENTVDHIVLGRGNPGGAWQTMSENVLTISISSWMDLPVFSFKMWKEMKKNGYNIEECYNNSETSHRVRVKCIAQYYTDYVNQMRLSKNFHNFTYVSAIRRINDFDQCNEVMKIDKNGCYQLPVWEVECCDTVKNCRYKYICQKVILAGGCSDIRNKLGIPGELSNPDWIFHDVSDLNWAIKSLSDKCKLLGTTDTTDPVLIVGSGLSAADSVLLANHHHSLPVLHIFTTCSFLDERHFTKNMYPEYNKVYRMMKNEKYIAGRNYRPLPQHRLMEISSTNGQKKVQIMSPNGELSWYKVSMVAIMVGYQPDLSCLPLELDNGKMLGVCKNQPIDSRKNPIAIYPWTHEVANVQAGLYAMGPIVGDNFVRVILGGAVAITSHIYKEHKKRKEEEKK